MNLCMTLLMSPLINLYNHAAFNCRAPQQRVSDPLPVRILS